MKWFPFFRNRMRLTAKPRLLEHDELRKIMEKERLRCRRNGSRFCLIKLELREQVDVPRQLAVIEKVLRGRLRKTDELGMLNPSDFGIILPDTPVDGSWKVIDDIIKLLPLTVDPTICTVYVYPREQVPDTETVDEIESKSYQGRSAKPLELLL